MNGINYFTDRSMWSMRRQRQAEKRRILLEFLRDEVFTTVPVVEQLLGLMRVATRDTLESMERDGLLTRHALSPQFGNVHLWGITAVGQVVVLDGLPGEAATAARHFRPSDVPLHHLRHTIDLQLARVAATQAGWSHWRVERALARSNAERVRVDAVATAPDGIRWAIEMERTRKTAWRYDRILFERLRAIKARQFDRCVWICPDRASAQSLRLLITSKPTVRHPVTGDLLTVHPSIHHPPLAFTSLDRWPNLN